MMDSELPQKPLRVALVQDCIACQSAQEPILRVWRTFYPQAPLYTAACDRRALSACRQTGEIRTSFLQRIPRPLCRRSLLLALAPLAYESFDLSGYDLVLSVSAGLAHGVITGPHTRHIAYIHAMLPYTVGGRGRHLVDGKGMPGLLRHSLHFWEAVAALRPDYFLTASPEVAARMSKLSHRPCTLCYGIAAENKDGLRGDLQDRRKADAKGGGEKSCADSIAFQTQMADLIACALAQPVPLEPRTDAKVHLGQRPPVNPFATH